MLYLDKKLLLLYAFLRRRPFNRAIIAEKLEISERHLTRLLNIWHQEKIIEYKKGQGRGIHSEVVFKVNPEERFVNQFMRNINQFTLNDIEKLLKLPISEVSKKVIKEKTESLFFHQSMKENIKENVFIDYIDFIPEEVTELNYGYSHSENILYNTMCRLYEIDHNGEITNELATFEEWHGNKLSIYIRKDVQFYNGDMLYASDVVKSLNRYLEINSGNLFDKIIHSIEVVSAFQLEITVAYRIDLIKPMLSSLETSIYKREGNHVLTTGPFYIDEVKHNSITLLRNPFYMNPAGDLEKVNLVNDINQYVSYLDQKGMESRLVSFKNRIEYVLLNPNSDSLNYYQRIYVLSVIQKFKEAFIRGDNKIGEEDFQSYQEILSNIDSDSIVFDRPLKLLCFDKVPYSLDSMVQFLIENGIPILTSYMTTEEYYNTDTRTLKVDVILTNEFIPEIFSYLNLISGGKFSEWFTESEIVQNLIYVYKNKHPEFWGYMEEKLNRYMIEGAYVLPITYTSKRINVPDSYKNISDNVRGVIDYNQIVIVEREPKPKKAN